MVQQALSQRVDEGVAELRRLEQDRLDALQVGVWERALAGDVTAVRAALRILDSRCRLLGLYQLSCRQGTDESISRTMVVTPG